MSSSEAAPAVRQVRCMTMYKHEYTGTNNSFAIVQKDTLNDLPTDIVTFNNSQFPQL